MYSTNCDGALCHCDFFTSDILTILVVVVVIVATIVAAVAVAVVVVSVVAVVLMVVVVVVVVVAGGLVIRLLDLGAEGLIASQDSSAEGSGPSGLESSGYWETLAVSGLEFSGFGYIIIIVLRIISYT